MTFPKAILEIKKLWIIPVLYVIYQNDAKYFANYAANLNALGIIWFWFFALLFSNCRHPAVFKMVWNPLRPPYLGVQNLQLP